MSFTPCGCFDIGLSERIKFYVSKKQRRTTVFSDDSMFDWLDRKKKKANEQAPNGSTLHNSSTKANGSLKVSHAQSPSVEPSVKIEDNSTIEVEAKQKKDLTPPPDQSKESPSDLGNVESVETVIQNGDCTNAGGNLASSNLKEPTASEPQSDEDSDSPVSNLLSSIGDDVDDVFQMAKRTISNFEDEASEFAKRLEILLISFKFVHLLICSFTHHYSCLVHTKTKERRRTHRDWTLRPRIRWSAFWQNDSIAISYSKVIF